MNLVLPPLSLLSFIWSCLHRQDLAAYPSHMHNEQLCCRQAAICDLFGLATREVCHAIIITDNPVVSYTTFSPFPQPEQIRQG